MFLTVNGLYVVISQTTELFSEVISKFYVDRIFIQSVLCRNKVKTEQDQKICNKKKALGVMLGTFCSTISYCEINFSYLVVVQPRATETTAIMNTSTGLLFLPFSLSSPLSMQIYGTFVSLFFFLWNYRKYFYRRRW
jgi:hypothetical protein